MENKLYIEKMGCDFYYNDPIEKISDMINHRYYIKDIKLKDGRTIDCIEIMNGARYIYKNGKQEKQDNFKLWLNTYYYDEDGNCTRIKEVEDYCNSKNLLYTQKNVLDIINNISQEKYTKIEIIERY